MKIYDAFLDGNKNVRVEDDDGFKFYVPEKWLRKELKATGIWYEYEVPGGESPLYNFLMNCTQSEVKLIYYNAKIDNVVKKEW